MSRQKRLRNHSLERCSNCCFPFSCLSWYSFLLASILSYFFPLFVLVFPVSSFFFPFPFIFFLISINQLNNRDCDSATLSPLSQSPEGLHPHPPTPGRACGPSPRQLQSTAHSGTHAVSHDGTIGRGTAFVVVGLLFSLPKKKKQSQDLTADWQVKGNEKGFQDRSNSRQKPAL